MKQALEKTIDLRSLAAEPPKKNAQECLRLMGMALKNLASAMNNTQALEAGTIILGSEPTPSAIAYRAEQLQKIFNFSDRRSENRTELPLCNVYG